VEDADVVGAGGIESGDIADGDRRVVGKERLGADDGSDVGERERAGAMEEADVGHAATFTQTGYGDVETQDGGAAMPNVCRLAP
jgi:hypothetical protein